MIDYDLHIHTEYCGHAPEMSIEAIIHQAEVKGLAAIAIVSHVFKEDDLELISKIYDDVSKIDTDVKVIVGAEIDVDGSATDGRLVTDRLDGISYIVGSIHYIPGLEIYPRSRQDNPLCDEEFFDKWASTILGLVSNPSVDTLAHPGRLFATACDVDVFFEDMLAVLKEAAEISVKNNIAWGINELNGLKIPAAYQRNWYRTFQVAVNAGVKLVYGSDAHKVKDIGKSDYCRTILQHLPEGCLATPESLGLLKLRKYIR